MKVNSTAAALLLSFSSLMLNLGMLLWAPLAETYSQKVVLMATTLCAVRSSFGIQYSKIIETLIICRMIQAFLIGSIAPNMNRFTADCWSHYRRAYAILFYGIALALATPLGPLIGNLIVARTGTAIVDGLWFVTAYTISMFLVACIIPESFPLVLLRRKAHAFSRQREMCIDPLLTTRTIRTVSLRRYLDQFLLRPFKLLTQEPTILSLGIYMAVVTGLQNLFLTAFPVVFGKG